MKNRPDTRRPLAHLAQRAFNRPLMIDPYKAEVIAMALRERLGIGSVERIDGTALDAHRMVAGPEDAYTRRRGDKLFHVDDNIAVIPVEGTLVHRFGELDPWSGMSGYDGLARKLRAALNDGEVRAIWFDIDSPGGEVAGLMTFVRELALSTQGEGGPKPIWAFVNEMACSAAYAIASVCDHVVGPQDAIVGSIGCCMLHVEFSRGAGRERRHRHNDPLRRAQEPGQ